MCRPSKLIWSSKKGCGNKEGGHIFVFFSVPSCCPGELWSRSGLVGRGREQGGGAHFCVFFSPELFSTLHSPASVCPLHTGTHPLPSMFTRVAAFVRLPAWGFCTSGRSSCQVWRSSWGRRELHSGERNRQQPRNIMDPRFVSQPREVPFARREKVVFCQESPQIGNPYLEDALLRDYLKSHLPPKVLAEVSADLERFGARVQNEIDALGRECELNPPKLQQFDAWGQRVDKLISCSAWKRMKEITAEEGLVAEAYERRYSHWSRIYQIAKMYLFAPSSGLFSCPVAITDGAAKVIESLGAPKPLEEAYARLTSRDPRIFWTSGQWMTERKGGSDVGNGTETVAHQQPDGTYTLHGLKWFSSATDSDMALALARIAGADGQVSKGVSLFYLKVRDEEGKLNKIEIQRLKDKLGTRQLPTAELLLDGTSALQISEEGRGIASIAHMLTLTRIHNSLSAVAWMRRIIHLARDYATKREAFGKFLKDHPLHMQTLARMEVQTRGAFLLLMEMGRLLGLEETKKASMEEQHLLRLLTAVVKLYSGKQALAVVSEGLECFGGQGYLEDVGFAAMARDAQILTIWEGTTNILSLDVLRSIVKSQGKVLDAFFSAAQAKLEVALGVSELEPSVQIVQKALQQLRLFVPEMRLSGEKAELAARDFAYSLARIYGGVLLLEHAARPSASATDIFAAQRWCQQDLCLVDREDHAGSYSPAAPSLDASLVFDGYPLVRGKL